MKNRGYGILRQDDKRLIHQLTKETRSFRQRLHPHITNPNTQNRHTKLDMSVVDQKKVKTPNK